MVSEQLENWGPKSKESRMGIKSPLTVEPSRKEPAKVRCWRRWDLLSGQTLP